jgi:hypothetical protein
VRFFTAFSYYLTVPRRISTIGYDGKEAGVKILWMSDSPTSPSGFGNVTRFFGSGLADRGHQARILG